MAAKDYPMPEKDENEYSYLRYLNDSTMEQAASVLENIARLARGYYTDLTSPDLENPCGEPLTEVLASIIVEEWHSQHLQNIYNR